MKLCRACQLFYQEQIMACQNCKAVLPEVTLSEALEFTRQLSFSARISGKDKGDLSDPSTQHHIRSYLKNHSLFLDYDLHKNQLRHGRESTRFFIAPLNLTCLFNLPWFFFNVVNTNLFHMQFTGYCPKCNSKINPQHHSAKECDYLKEYFHILDDILNGRIVSQKPVYEHYAQECRRKNVKSAYDDLFCRPVRWEIFFDLMSIGLSLAFWIYLAVNISWPMFNVLLQQLHQADSYELSL